MSKDFTLWFGKTRKRYCTSCMALTDHVWVESSNHSDIMTLAVNPDWWHDHNHIVCDGCQSRHYWAVGDTLHD